MKFERGSCLGAGSREGRAIVSKTFDALRDQMNAMFDMIESKGSQSPLKDSRCQKSLIVRRILSERRRRSVFFNPQLFGEPAWEILLELFAQELDQQKTSVTDLCLVSGVPSTTALRWIANLEHEGLIQRQKDPLDGRRIWVELTAAGSKPISLYFDNFRLELA